MFKRFRMRQPKYLAVRAVWVARLVRWILDESSSRCTFQSPDWSAELVAAPAPAQVYPCVVNGVVRVRLAVLIIIPLPSLLSLDPCRVVGNKVGLPACTCFLEKKKTRQKQTKEANGKKWETWNIQNSLILLAVVEPEMLQGAFLNVISEAEMNGHEIFFSFRNELSVWVSVFLHVRVLEPPHEPHQLLIWAFLSFFSRWKIATFHSSSSTGPWCIVSPIWLPPIWWRALNLIYGLNSLLTFVTVESGNSVNTLYALVYKKSIYYVCLLY